MHVIELRLVLRLLGHSYLVHGHIQLNPCGAQLIVSEAQAMLLIIGYFCDKQLGGVSSHWPSFRKLFFFAIYKFVDGVSMTTHLWHSLC